jgi:hypothetical protein
MIPGSAPGTGTNLGHDEAFLKVCMNLAGCLWGLRPLLNGPGLDFVRAGREEVLQLQSFVALKLTEKDC